MNRSSIMVVVGIVFTAWAAEGGEASQGDSGIAARYTGDAGIESDPDVLFVEQFEEDSLATQYIGPMRVVVAVKPK